MVFFVPSHSALPQDFTYLLNTSVNTTKILIESFCPIQLLKVSSSCHVLVHSLSCFHKEICGGVFIPPVIYPYYS